tara:strand:+ start:2028 stop:2429 length:402 start_codon:yes stop_codon:yes gene_type:complete
MQERQFITKVHKNLSSDIYKWKINDSYTGGVPDCFYTGPAGHCFVEYKYKKELPKRDTTLINFNLSVLQAIWLTERNKQGVPCYLVVAVGNLVVITQNFEKANKYLTSEFLEDSMTFEDFVAKLTKMCVEYGT